MSIYIVTRTAATYIPLNRQAVPTLPVPPGSIFRLAHSITKKESIKDIDTGSIAPIMLKVHAGSQA